MLSPDSRVVAMDILHPPAGYRLDRTVLTTYSLDLEVLLALPLAVLTHSDVGIEDLLQDPLLLLQALREAGERVHVFVDETGIAVPGAKRTLYGALENSVHPVRIAEGGAFHAKSWFVRFLDEQDRPLLRVAIASRNLTFDRCWDIAMVSDAAPVGKRRRAVSGALGDLLRELPSLAVLPLEDELSTGLLDLAADFECSEFPAPDGFEGSIRFHGPRLSRSKNRIWHPWDSGQKLLAVSPFVSRMVLDILADTANRECCLISRREELDRIPEQALATWDEALVLSDAATDEPEDGLANRPSGLHAKLIAMEQGRYVSWLAGSANLTQAAFSGRNIELMAEITGPRRKFGIQPFIDSGFLKLCEPYRRSEMTDKDQEAERARHFLEQARSRIVNSDMRMVCRANGDGYFLEVQGESVLPDGIEAHVWPVSLGEEQALQFNLPVGWHLPISRLTAFLAVRLSVSAEVDDLRFVIKLPATGFPEGRVAQVLRTLVDSPERFLQFLRALLGGLESIEDLSLTGSASWRGNWGAGLGGETLLEDLVRIASRDPERLEPVRRLIEDLRENSEGREIVPDDLYKIWQVVDEAADTYRSKDQE